MIFCFDQVLTSFYMQRSETSSRLVSQHFFPVVGNKSHQNVPLSLKKKKKKKQMSLQNYNRCQNKNIKLPGLKRKKKLIRSFRAKVLP